MAEVISLADRLKHRREELGLSQAQAARELDVARTAYRLWEMEAAKPQPDRWRLISRWLGVSVTTMLLADELDETRDASVTAAFERVGRDWQETISDPFDFFTHLRDAIQKGTEKGFVSTSHAQELLGVIASIEEDRIGMDTNVWEPAQLHKQFRANNSTPKQARDAVSFVAADLREDQLYAAQLLTTELVTNSITHGPNNGPISLDIDVNRDRIRVEVRDRATGTPEVRTPSHDGGYGLTLADRLAARWGTERERTGNLTWFEIDLPQPGAQPERH